MASIIQYLKYHFTRHDHRRVALVLGGGGARGYAHIGAIEVLQKHGYEITSIAGTSMGALVGGLFAAGKLEELKQMVLSIKKRQILSLVDVSPGLNHIATADNLSKLLDKMVGGINIEQLPIPFCCSASDISSGKEYVFRKGSLSSAIRASISIPGIFSPVRVDGKILVDGSVHNTLPLNRVDRNKGDILVAINASAPDTKSHFMTKPDHNLFKLSMRVAQISIQNNTQMSMSLNPPDICVNISMDSFGLLEFNRGREIIEFGRKAMEKQILEYETKQRT